MAIPQLGAFPAPPLLGQDQTTFNTNASATLSYMFTWATEMNAVSSAIDSAGAEIEASRVEVANNRTNVALDAQRAEVAATRAESAANNPDLVDAYSMSASDIRNTALSKASFEALARDNRYKFAGSGDVSLDSTLTSVNTGILTDLTVNTFIHGLATKNVNGNILNYSSQGVHLPQAPTVYPFGTTLTPEQIASGVIAHADASNSGLILNGKFETDTIWLKTDASITITGGDAVFAASPNNANVNQTIDTVIGKKDIVEFDVTVTSGTFRLGVLSGGIYTFIDTSISGRVEVSFTPTATTTNVYIQALGSVTGTATSCAVFPKDAISRQDLVLLKSEHKDTSEKGVLYDLGNIQFKGTISAGTAGTFAGQDTYSRFGIWQAPSALVGNSISIASLTSAQLKDFVGNPENNCYYDGDKLMQVEYKMVTHALDNDDYSEVTAMAKLGYTPHAIELGLYVHADGSEGIPIALPSRRRNQFGYDVTFNPKGTATPIGTPTVTSIADCLDPTKFNIGTSGNIASGTTGNPNGYYYDQIHESDFADANGGADLRTSAQVKQYKLQFESLVARDALSDLTHYPVTTEVGLVQLATDGVRYLEYSPTTKRVYYTNATNQYQTDSFIKEGAIS